MPEPEISPKQIAFYDPERKGMFIHKDQLVDSPFEVGDRFSVRKGKRELFAMTIVKDDQGDILTKTAFSSSAPAKSTSCWAGYSTNMFFTSNLRFRKPSR